MNPANWFAAAVFTLLAVAAAPTLMGLVGAFIPLVLVLGVVIAALRIVWFYTRS